MSQKLHREDARKALLDALEGVGVGAGDTVFLGIDMGMIPLPHIEIVLSRDAIVRRNMTLCEFVFKTIKNVIGETGTIVVPTYSYSCTRPGSIYIHEETPSEVGPFTEYIRRLPESKRSIHPIFSVCAIGHLSEELTEDCGPAAFGACSPFARLALYGAKFLNLGVPFHCSVTYAHHLEQMFGCNHRYNKVLKTTVLANGSVLSTRFLAYLRYRGVSSDVSLLKLENLLMEHGVLTQMRVDGSLFQCVSANEVEKFGYAALKRDQTFFLTHDVMIHLDDSLVCDQLLDDQEVTFDLKITPK